MDLARYRRRFGGEGTIVTLPDGRAFTAAHCVSAIDGRRGAVLIGPNGRQWRMVRRWSPRGRDLARLDVAAGCGERRAGASNTRALSLPDAVRVGVELSFYGFSGRRFVRRQAVVVAVASQRAIAEVHSRAGVRDGDSGGPVLIAGQLAGIVVARVGSPRGAAGSSHLVFTRLDLPGV